MPQAWKLPHLAKGLLTWVPPLAAWRARRGEHAAPARYCYAVWLRHLVLLAGHGFRPDGARVAELGPGQSPGGGVGGRLRGGARGGGGPRPRAPPGAAAPRPAARGAGRAPGGGGADPGRARVPAAP